MALQFILSTAKTLDMKAPPCERLPLGGDRVAGWVEHFPNAIKDNTNRLAIRVYNGWVFKQLTRASWTPLQWAYADEHCLILSALWGPLRPFDGIKPYRLDFKALGAKGRKAWLTRFEDLLRQRLGKEPFLNLASAEFSAMVPSDLERVDVNFAQKLPDGSLRRFAVLAKTGRGELADAIITNQVENLSDVKGLTTASGFTYEPSLSSSDQWTFLCPGE